MPLENARKKVGNWGVTTMGAGVGSLVVLLLASGAVTYKSNGPGEDAKLTFDKGAIGKDFNEFRGAVGDIFVGIGSLMRPDAPATGGLGAPHNVDLATSFVVQRPEEVTAWQSSTALGRIAVAAEA